MIQPRKLAAVDVFLLGPTVVCIEFAVALVLGGGLGILILARGHSFQQRLLGGYILLLGLNYVPLLWHALRMKSRERAAAELGSELENRSAMAAKYRRQSLYLLLPLVTPIAAFREYLARVNESPL